MDMTTQTVLIANRGEIACRIIRSAKEMGLRTVAVYSSADANAPHVALADDAVLIGAGPVGESYLDGAKILDAARESGAGLIHPGYGFLSENAEFAGQVADAGLIFIGPPPEAVEAMGDKARAKVLMRDAGVPVVPGYESDVQSDDSLCAAADEIGFPVMVKASAGGGGRGMRLVRDPAELPEALGLARSEARNAFGSDHLILEKAVENARHVEIQVFADGHGTCLHLFERDCSVQRRHQKVIEEAPCPALTPELRTAMGQAAVEAARAVNYRGAGTVEFLLDDAGNFYFLEMNTRLQVEHPVTEMITGLDLVAMQIDVALGQPLGLTQDDVQMKGHAIELRLCAEDPAQDFLPVTGDISLWSPATGPGLRVDAGIQTGSTVSPFYDPMLAKLIAWGPTRDVARQRAIAALNESAVLGLATNAAFLKDLLEQPAFAQGEARTNFIAQTYPDGVKAAPVPSSSLAVAAALELRGAQMDALAASTLSDDSLTGLGAVPARLELDLAGETHAMTAHAVPGGWRIAGQGWEHQVDIALTDDTAARITLDGRREAVQFARHADGIDLSRGGQNLRLTHHRPWLAAAGAAGSGQITAPMPGAVISVEVAEGDRVEAGQTLVVLEAMKMQHKLVADLSGTVQEISAKAGAQVEAGRHLVTIKGDDI